MTVDSFKTLISPLKKTYHISNSKLKGKTIAIDAHRWLYLGCYGHAKFYQKK